MKSRFSLICIIAFAVALLSACGSAPKMYDTEYKVSYHSNSQEAPPTNQWPISTPSGQEYSKQPQQQQAPIIVYPPQQQQVQQPAPVINVYTQQMPQQQQVQYLPQPQYQTPRQAYMSRQVIPVDANGFGNDGRYYGPGNTSMNGLNDQRLPVPTAVYPAN